MLSTKLTVAAAVLLGAISIAQAAGGSDYRSRGGYDIGPVGQCFDPPACGQGRRGAAYAYAYSNRYLHGRYYTPGYGWHNGPPR
jgi:hypothetical protein